MTENPPGGRVTPEPVQPPGTREPASTDAPSGNAEPASTDAPSSPGGPSEVAQPARSAEPARPPAAKARLGKKGRRGAGANGRGGAREQDPLSFRARYAAPAGLVREALAQSAVDMRANLGAYLLAGAISLIPFFYVSTSVLLAIVRPGGTPAASLDLVSIGLVFLAASVYLSFIQTGFVHAALKVEAGEKVRVGDFFTVPNRGKGFLTSLVATPATGVGYLIYLLPGLLIGVWTVFAVTTAVDRGLGPIKAIKASFKLVGRNPVAAMLLGLLVHLLVGLGALLLYFPGIGLLVIYTPVVVTAPIVVQAVVRLYRTFEGLPDPVVPPRRR